jgi:hypothetical protein
MQGIAGLSLQNDTPDMCDRCSAIVWEPPQDCSTPPSPESVPFSERVSFSDASSLTEISLNRWSTTSSSSSKRICILHETIEELVASSCRICRLSGMSIPKPCEFTLPIDVVLHRTGGIYFYVHNEAGGSYKMSFSLPRASVLWPSPRVSLQFYDYPKDDLLAQRIQGDHLALVDRLNGDRDSKIELIKGWLEFCTTDPAHEQCAPTQYDYLPGLKVIDCYRLCVVQAPPSCLYLALSYVWGKVDKDRKLAPNLSNETLPRTIKDSITVTRLLEYQYLWIDRYVCSPEATWRPY